MEDGDNAKGKGKSKQKNNNNDEAPKAKAGDTGKGDNKPKAKSHSKASTKPQRYKWVEDAGHPFGSNCQFTHTPEVKGQCYNVEPLII